MDFQKNHVLSANSYWTHSYLLHTQNSFIKFIRFKRSTALLHKIHFNWTTTKFSNQSKFTIQHSSTPIIPVTYKSLEWNKLFSILNKLRPTINKVNWRRQSVRWDFDKFFFNYKFLNKNKFKYLLKKYLFKNKFFVFKDSKLWQLFDINFLRKERLYTKLKYSRTPQYDIVSGGSAALLSGFLGFLICEKFGFELLDSGDFYYLFMYLVFFGFCLRLLLKLTNNEKTEWSALSYKWGYVFFKFNYWFAIKRIKKIINYFFIY